MRAVIGQPLRPWDRPRRAANVKAATRRKRWPTASLVIATATRSAARTRGWPETRRAPGADLLKGPDKAGVLARLSLIGSAWHLVCPGFAVY